MFSLIALGAVMVLASIGPVEPAIIGGAFMTFNSILTFWLTRRFESQERALERKHEDERAHEDELKRRRRRRQNEARKPKETP